MEPTVLKIGQRPVDLVLLVVRERRVDVHLVKNRLVGEPLILLRTSKRLSLTGDAVDMQVALEEALPCQR